MGKKKAGGSKAAAAPKAVKLTPPEVVAAALAAALPDGDADAIQLAAEMILEGLDELKAALPDISDAVQEKLSDAGVDCNDDELATAAKGLCDYRLGLANPKATFTTTAGSFVAEIFVDKMPLTAGNFVELVEAGFYDGLHFHRVIEGFMCQFGCPISKDPKAEAGAGGPEPGSTFAYVAADGAEVVVTRGTEGDEAGCIQDELTHKITNSPGTLAMANSDAPNTGGSQFFLNVAENTALNWWDDESPSRHPVFGKICVEDDDGAGMDVLMKISKVTVDDDEKPVKPVKVKSVVLG